MGWPLLPSYLLGAAAGACACGRLPYGACMAVYNRRRDHATVKQTAMSRDNSLVLGADSIFTTVRRANAC